MAFNNRPWKNIKVTTEQMVHYQYLQKFCSTYMQACQKEDTFNKS